MKATSTETRKPRTQSIWDVSVSGRAHPLPAASSRMCPGVRHRSSVLYKSLVGSTTSPGHRKYGTHAMTLAPDLF